MKTTLIERIHRLTTTLHESPHSIKREIVKAVLPLVSPNDTPACRSMCVHHILEGMSQNPDRIQRFVESMSKKLTIDVVEQAFVEALKSYQR